MKNRYEVVLKLPVLSLFIGIVLLTFASCNIVRCQDNWEVTSPKEQQMNDTNLSQLDEFINQNLPHLQSLLIARHGKLVFEQYYHGGSKTEMHNMQSITKSITSALVGIALKMNYLKSLDQKIVDFFPEATADPSIDSRVKNITINHLLTMSSGIVEENSGLDKDDNPFKTALQQQLKSDPGTQFNYSSLAAHVFTGILARATGESLYDFADKSLFQPLGIKKVIWYTDKNGMNLGCGSSLWQSQDLLKIGQLYLNKGKWNGIEIIPQEYVKQSGKTKISGDFYGVPVTYGYLWFTDTISDKNVFLARGYGGQYLMVIPDLDMTILCTSDWHQPEYPEHYALVKNYIIPSVIK
jgi:CubicO group peptidase (beta-lactamase class C family)